MKGDGMKFQRFDRGFTDEPHIRWHHQRTCFTASQESLPPFFKQPNFDRNRERRSRDERGADLAALEEKVTKQFRTMRYRLIGIAFAVLVLFVLVIKTISVTSDYFQSW